MRRRIRRLAEVHAHHLVVARLADVEGHRQLGLADARPERIEVRVRGRAPVGRSRSQRDHASTLLDHELELGDRPLEIEQAQQRRSIDAVAMVESPFLVEPAVEGVEVRVHLLGVVLAKARENLDRALQAQKEADGQDRTVP